MIHTPKDIPIIGIYKITSPTNKVYIGQSVDIEDRFENYKKLKNCKNQIRLFNSLKKHGPKNHIFEVVEKCTLKQLNEKERYWQDFFNVLSKNGLNCILTKTNSKSGKQSKKTCKKRSKSMKGKYIRLGAVLSEDTKELMRLAAEGKPKPWLKGRIIQKLIGRKRSEEELDKFRKKVLQYDKQNTFIKEWNSIKEAATKLKIHESGITTCCKKRQKTCGGYIWKYKE